MDKLANKRGIQLNIGCGKDIKPGWVGIDILPLPGVDIVWDLETTPWPLDDESVVIATASHVLEHITPHKGTFIRVMDEIWRILKPGCQFAFVVPYAGTHGDFQDPTHINHINESTMYYFDPEHATGFYQFYEPKPWKIERSYMDRENGFLEVLLKKREIRDINYSITDEVTNAYKK